MVLSEAEDRPEDQHGHEHVQRHLKIKHFPVLPDVWESPGNAETLGKGRSRGSQGQL